MFWRVSGLNTASPVDSILDKESYSLEELLDEDELIQECKSLNARLTAYLKQRDTVEKLVRYLVEEPPPNADPKRSFKYPFTACEVFCCEVEGIFNTLLEHEELLGRLFSLLEAPRPLNCMLAGYFSRVMGSLLLRRTQEVMQYLQRHQDLLPRLVHHCDTTSVAEVLVRLVGADEQRTFLPTNHLQWLSDTDLLYQLLDRLQPGQPIEAQGNAAEVLAALAQSQSSPLTKNLADPAFLELLVQRALRRPAAHAAAAAEESGEAGAAGHAEAAESDAAAAEEASCEAEADGDAGDGGEAAAAAAATASEGAKAGGGADDAATPPSGAAGPSGDEDSAASSAAMVHALNVCIALVEPLPPSPAEAQAAAGGMGMGSPLVQGVDAAAAEVHAVMRAQATRCIAASIDALVALLEAPDPARVLPTSYGLLRPPVGLARLKAVELLAALLHSGDEAAEAAVMGTRGVQRCLELFLAAPFNNVLHRHVAVLLGALGGGSPGLARFLLEDCRLLGWLVEAPLEITPPRRPDGGDGAPRRPLRAGYAGHITQVCNRLLQLAAEGHPQLRAAMDADPAWQTYVHEQLQPRNAREDVNAWQCGRPTAHEPVTDPEGELFQAELDFGAGEGEAFTRDVYQRYGVFSSHEEEEVDAEQPQWALELASAASAAGAAPPGGGGGAAAAAPPPGKLPVPGADGPQPFPVYDSSSSSGSSSGEESDEENVPRRGGSSSNSEEGEVSVTPAPEADGGAVAAQGSGGGAPARLPLGSDDADMADDAVMLEYDAAEQLVSLGQLSLEERGGGGDNDDDGGAAGNGAAAAADAHGEQRGGDAGEPLEGDAAAPAGDGSPKNADEPAGSPLKGGAGQRGDAARERPAAAVGT